MFTWSLLYLVGYYNGIDCGTVFHKVSSVIEIQHPSHSQTRANKHSKTKKALRALSDDFDVF